MLIIARWFFELALKLAVSHLILHTLQYARIRNGFVSWPDIVYLLTYLLTYLHNWLGRIKPAISPKRLKIEQKLLFTT